MPKKFAQNKTIIYLCLINRTKASLIREAQAILIITIAFVRHQPEYGKIIFCCAALAPANEGYALFEIAPPAGCQT